MVSHHLNFAIRCTNRCNLDCRYCYAKVEHPSDMSYETLCRTMAEMDRFCPPSDVIIINWTGGEPLILGHRFLEDIMSAQAAYASRRYDNILQSNLTLMDDWHVGFIPGHFSEVRTSLDLPREQHEEMRGAGNFDATMDRIRTLRDAGILVNINIVVTDRNVGAAEEMYRFVRDNGIESMSLSRFIPRGNGERNRSLAVRSNEEYADLLISLCDIWMDDEGTPVRRITPLDKLIRSCRGSDIPCFHCQEQLLAIGPDGGIYPSCNKFLVHEETCIGNVNVDGFDGALASSVRSGVLSKVNEAIGSICSSCEHFGICKGGCYFVAFEQEPVDGMTRDEFCKGYHRVFSHILDLMAKGKVK